ncbi:hypothetical protein K439DRAFT_1508637, partial [Ramaria rubella]
NTQIERLWVEVTKQFVRHWRAFCMCLECMHGLDHDNPHHPWLHHHLFLSLINADCDAFKTEWNMHPLSGHQDKSSLDLHFISQTEHGFAVDDSPDVHPEILERYHSVDIGRTHQEHHQTGAGYPSDESDNESASSDTLTDSSSGSDHEEGENSETNELRRQIATDIHANVYHKPIKTPWSQNPFEHPAQEMIFFVALNTIQTAQLILLGFGLKTSKWEDGEYPSYKVITFGRRKEITIELPASIWLPRAIAWGQALHCMQCFLFQIADG